MPRVITDFQLINACGDNFFGGKNQHFEIMIFFSVLPTIPIKKMLMVYIVILLKFLLKYDKRKVFTSAVWLIIGNNWADLL